MKKIYLILAVLSCFVLSSFAQNNYSSGYRAYLDLEYTIGIGDYEFNRYGVSTSHGYQINPFIYFGIGAGMHFMSEYETSGSYIALDCRESSTEIPVFAHVKCNFSKSKIIPFIDLKGGKFITNNGGIYANLSGGIRIAINDKNAINVSIGYTLQEHEFEIFDRFLGSSSMAYSREARILETEGITIKVGYEF